MRGLLLLILLMLLDSDIWEYILWRWNLDLLLSQILSLVHPWTFLYSWRSGLHIRLIQNKSILSAWKLALNMALLGLHIWNGLIPGECTIFIPLWLHRSIQFVLRLLFLAISCILTDHILIGSGKIMSLLIKVVQSIPKSLQRLQVHYLLLLLLFSLQLI